MLQLLLVTLCALLPQGASIAESVGHEGPRRIAFGSCYRLEGPAEVWSTIAAAEPDLLVLLGDNVYADSDDASELAAAWARLAAIAVFAGLRERVELLATWDDHDYGRDDAGAEFPIKAQSQTALLDFLGVGDDSPRRAREGVYHARVFGPPGERVQVIVLDTRYHRTSLTRNEGPLEEWKWAAPYQAGPDGEGTLLGETQWTWLEQQLREPAELRLIGSSIQFVAHESGGENWGNFPHERRRMNRLLAATGAKGVVFLSGDRHAAELSVLPTQRDGLDAGYALFDVTSSALNQSRTWAPERNGLRLGDQWFGPNFGLVEIDFDAERPHVELSVRDAGDGGVLMRRRLFLDELSAPAIEPDVVDPRALSRIAFGSCNDQRRPTPLWDHVVAANPDLFLFLGDNVYGDTVDMNHLRAQYALLAAQPGYAALRAGTRVLATWDDHDLGQDDGGASYPRKRDSKEIMFAHFDVPADSPRRAREGVYGSWTFGPPERSVQVILLDLRTFKSPWVRRHEGPARGDGHPGGYAPNLDPGATMLGEEQWHWFEEQLRTPARVRLIGTSLQALSEGCHWEGWAMMPLERQRLLHTIRESGAGGVVLLSGDTHWAELSRVDPWDSGVGYPLFELTSSGMNQGWEFTQIENPHRVGSPLWVANWGLVEIDWERPDPLVSLTATAEDGRRLREDVPLSTLAPPLRHGGVR
ncbi:alkaline phosphatase D family protein [Engelhardtia mirabilis]|uniref:Alkaline phosphatase D n=1 Tax=Engelhardtia mirabilis TaxID=2528011 RepID=A0A518BIM9_9BACT|nr:Alkaline phosphatase D precursor [Planctomycetes bacterium Pla133]QDV01165.1 Alkaline phosphatase D precursor [Planctomycetes bacterium Pla86]